LKWPNIYWAKTGRMNLCRKPVTEGLSGCCC